MIWDISSGDLRRLWKTTTNGPIFHSHGYVRLPGGLRGIMGVYITGNVYEHILNNIDIYIYIHNGI